MKILRVLFLTNAAIAGSMLLNSCGGVPEDMPPISGLQAYVKASNTGAADEFGFAVALSSDGNTLVVGAPGEASARTGVTAGIVDETTAGNAAPGAGAVYVYTRTGATWTQQAYVKASNTGAGDQFGSSVALSSDGNTLAVGATGEAGDAGAVYVFTRAGTWSPPAFVKASNPGAGDQFGFSVALSGDGNTLAVSATGEDSALTDVRTGIVDETTAGNAAPGAGAVYVFTLIAGTWSQQAYVKASNTGAGDQFGFSVALSSDGVTLAVGAIGEDSSAIGIDGSQTDSAATTNAGAVYVFTFNGTTWPQQAYIKASNTGAVDLFGGSVSLSGDGNILAVGAIGESSAATGIGGNQADNAAANAGAVYVFTRSITATWTQQIYV